MPKLYIAGPYTAPTLEETEQNVLDAIDAGIEVYRRGWIPFIPHLSHYVALRNAEHPLRHGIRLEYEDYIAMDDVWLYACDAFLYLNPSPGADRELLLAATRPGMPIYCHTDQIPFGSNAHPTAALQTVVKTWEHTPDIEHRMWTVLRTLTKVLAE